MEGAICQSLDMNTAYELNKKIDKALLLLTSVCENKPVEVCYSGGKDSETILELAKMAGINYQPFYKNTTIDPPMTIKHVQSKGATIITPKYNFFELVKRNGMPTRRARFCCRYLKEYKVLDVAIQGIRVSESKKREKRYSINDPVVCRFYGSKKQHVNVIYPILSWSDNDVKDFIKDRNIRCHPLYYDKEGNFCVKRRLGCIGCPLQADAGKEDFKMYPKFFKRLVECVCIWWDTHPDAKSHKKFLSPYGLIAHNLFYGNFYDWQSDNYSLFGYRDWKAVLEEYFSIEL